ncbi:MAG TPA: FliH/SctL family protein, partial [Candidatus Berkiella sp.]|nr:FliH/SctL family protein [Candidatus Berkiella sp.]
MAESHSKWALPEFGLVMNVHHTTNKSLKINQNTAASNAVQAELQQKGYDVGFEKGYAEGLHKAEQETQRQKQQLESLIKQLHEDNQAILQEKEQAILLFVKSLCEKVLHKELATSSETIMNVITQALKMIDNSGKEIRIACHPKLYEKIQNEQFNGYSRVIFDAHD